MSLIREQFSLRLATFAVGLPARRQPRPRRVRVRRHRRRDGALRRLPLHRGAARRGRRVGGRVFGSYRYAERVFLLAVPRVPRLPDRGRPRPSRLGRGRHQHLSSRTSSASKEFLFLAVALIGTTITPYMQLYQAAAVADRGTDPRRLRAIRIDTITGSIFANFISMSIIIATAAGHRRHRTRSRRPPRPPRPSSRSPAPAPRRCSPSACSARRCSPPPSSRCRPPTRLAEAVGVGASVSRRFRDAPLFLGLFTAQIVDRRRRRPRARQPDRPAAQHAGAQRVHHARSC